MKYAILPLMLTLGLCSSLPLSATERVANGLYARVSRWWHGQTQGRTLISELLPENSRFAALNTNQSGYFSVIAGYMPLVTKQFIKNEFKEPKNQLKGLAWDQTNLEKGIQGLQRYIAALEQKTKKFDQDFAQVSTQTQKKLHELHEGLAHQAVQQEHLDSDIKANHLDLQKTRAHIAQAKYALESLQPEIDTQRERLIEESDDVRKTQKVVRNALAIHESETDSRLATLLAIVESQKQAITLLSQTVHQASDLAKKRESEQQDIAQKLVRLHEQAHMQTNEVADFGNRFNEFKKRFEQKFQRKEEKISIIPMPSFRAY